MLYAGSTRTITSLLYEPLEPYGLYDGCSLIGLKKEVPFTPILHIAWKSQDIFNITLIVFG